MMDEGYMIEHIHQGCEYMLEIIVHNVKGQIIT
jgi:hypothetical protein